MSSSDVSKRAGDVRGLSVSEVVPPRLSVPDVFSLPPLLSEVFPPRSVLEVAQSLAGLGLPVLSSRVPVSARYPIPRLMVRLGCPGCSDNLYGCYIHRRSPIPRPKMALNRLPLSLMSAR
mgnify:CR=1 FL=1